MPLEACAELNVELEAGAGLLVAGPGLGKVERDAAVVGGAFASSRCVGRPSFDGDGGRNMEECNHDGLKSNGKRFSVT